MKAAGFTDDQAEAVTRVMRRAQDIDLSNLATKADIAVLRSDIDLLRAGTKTDIAEVKADLLNGMVGAIGFQTVVILGAVFALAPIVRP